MNHDILREIGTPYEHEESGITLWIHPDDSFGASVITSEVLSKLPNGLGDSSALNTFYIANAYVLSWEGDKEHNLIKFLSQRSPFDVLGNLELFGVYSNRDVNVILASAYTNTRRVQETVDPESKKKNSSNDGSEKVNSVS